MPSWLAKGQKQGLSAGHSRRTVKHLVGSSSTVYIYDGWNMIADYTIQNSKFTIHHSHTWGMDLSGSMQGAGGVGGLLMVTDHGSPSTDHFYPTYDGNGNVSEYLDSSGVVQAHYEYDAFGNTTVSSGAKAADFAHRFSTKPLDGETGLYYYGYRYYDPVTGRWPSRDPIWEYGGFNLYGMVGNDPVNWIDLLGLVSAKDCYKKCEEDCKNDGGILTAVLTPQSDGSRKCSCACKGKKGDPVMPKDPKKVKYPPSVPPEEDVKPPQRIRIMPPTKLYPDGYWKREAPGPGKKPWIQVDPSTGKPCVSTPDAHVPFPPGWIPKK